MNEYIEREVIEKKFSEELHTNYLDDYEKGFQAALFAVMNLPTADAVPIRHGYWNTGYFHDRVCSCCLHPDNDLNDYAHDYCPNCGSKMDGELE